MGTSARTIETSSVRPGGVRCMRANGQKVTIVEEVPQPERWIADVAKTFGANANPIFRRSRLLKLGLLVQCRELAKWLPVGICQL